MKDYNVVNGTSYHKETPIELVNILETIRIGGIRVKLHYGDTKTGVDWNEEFDVTGYIGRSTGQSKIPLLIYRKGTMGGSSILDHCILKIKLSNGGKVLYKHPKYQERTIEIVEGDIPLHPFNTTINGRIYGRHYSKKSAEKVMRSLS